MTATAIAEASASRERTIRLGGLACLIAGALGAASGVFLAAYPAQGSEDTWRYPLSAEGFAAIQVWFAFQHLGLLVGILALLGAGVLGAGVLGGGRLGRLGVSVAAVGMSLLTVTEVLAVTARHSALDEHAYLNALYGVSSILSGVGLIAAGVAIRRAGAWTGWRSWVVLVGGVWVFVPMFPAMVAGFLAARLGITGWMLVFAALGWALFRSEDPSDGLRAGRDRRA